MRRVRNPLCALLLATAAAAPASDLNDFHIALEDAWRFYRSAQFYLRTGNAMVAGFELEQMQSRWQAMQGRFAAAPPDAYADDPHFASVLQDGADSIAVASDAAGAGDAEGASAALAPLGDELAGLRRRAGVRVFSDCIAEANAAMDGLYAFRHDPPPLADRQAANAIKAAAAVARYTLARCDTAAVDSIRNDTEFRRLVDGSLASLATLFEAVDNEDRTAVINLLRELRSFDRMLALHFG